MSARWDKVVRDELSCPCSGLNRRLRPKKLMLTKSATITRACSASPRISSTQPVSVSLRNISRGSHQNAQRLTAGPEQHCVEQGHAHGPQGKHRESRATGGLVLVRIARERQVGVEVAARRLLIVLEGLDQEGPEDPRRCARQHQEGEAERRRQHSLQPGGEPSADSRCEGLIAPLAAALDDFSTDEARGAHEYDDQRPVTQAGSRYNEDAFKLGWHLEEVDPPGEMLQPQGWSHIVDTRHSSDALVEAHECLDLVPHPRLSPDGLNAAGGRTAADYGEEDEQQHHAHQDNGSGCHVTAIVAARLQLVKIPGVCGPIAQLASRPEVARFAVAVAVT
eukprot:2108633-Prymnesium_polylepis.1